MHLMRRSAWSMIMAGSIYSVAQVNSYIKNLFVQDFLLNRISVRGEVSNCKYHTSGHIYFTLKDKSGTLSAVMFAGQRKGLTFQLQEGQQVVVTGSIDIYERDGRYQLYARNCGTSWKRWACLPQSIKNRSPNMQKP